MSLLSGSTVGYPSDSLVSCISGSAAHKAKIIPSHFFIMKWKAPLT